MITSNKCYIRLISILKLSLYQLILLKTKLQQHRFGPLEAEFHQLRKSVGEALCIAAAKGLPKPRGMYLVKSAGIQFLRKLVQGVAPLQQLTELAVHLPDEGRGAVRSNEQKAGFSGQVGHATLNKPAKLLVKRLKIPAVQGG